MNIFHEVMNDNVEALQQYLKDGGDPDVTTELGSSLIEMCDDKCFDIAINHINMFKKDKDNGNTILHKFVFDDDINKVKKILSVVKDDVFYKLSEIENKSYKKPFAYISSKDMYDFFINTRCITKDVSGLIQYMYGYKHMKYSLKDYCYMAIDKGFDCRYDITDVIGE